MNDIGLLLGMFSITVLVHSLIHHLWRRVAKPPIALLALYGIGVLYAIIKLPISLAAIYVLLSVISAILYVGVLVEGETPTSLILSSFARDKTQTITSLMSLFTEDMLLWRRLRDLMASGLVERRGTRYMITKKGAWIVRCIRWYMFVTGRPLGG